MTKYVEKDDLTFKVVVTYSKGGYSYITNKEEKRGYTLSIIPVEIERKDGYKVEKTVAFSGYKQFLLEVGRKSNKAMEKAVAMAEEIEEDIMSRILEEM